jgi:hypothetical protein
MFTPMYNIATYDMYKPVEIFEPQTGQAPTDEVN